MQARINRKKYVKLLCKFGGTSKKIKNQAQRYPFMSSKAQNSSWDSPFKIKKDLLFLCWGEGAADPPWWSQCRGQWPCCDRRRPTAAPPCPLRAGSGPLRTIHQSAFKNFFLSTNQLCKALFLSTNRRFGKGRVARDREDPALRLID